MVDGLGSKFRAREVKLYGQGLQVSGFTCQEIGFGVRELGFRV